MVTSGTYLVSYSLSSDPVAAFNAGVTLYLNAVAVASAATATSTTTVTGGSILLTKTVDINAPTGSTLDLRPVIADQIINDVLVTIVKIA
uniref:hypothetical protein n=1 Tax=Bacillus cereus TaxID=1396 RepID=UPI002852AE69|nr:hypothetical protein [Bacillus cereus]WLE91097.1 hypothetical protein GGBNIMDK_00128 [Bacillus cereus]